MGLIKFSAASAAHWILGPSAHPPSQITRYFLSLKLAPTAGIALT